MSLTCAACVMGDFSNIAAKVSAVGMLSYEN